MKPGPLLLLNAIWALIVAGRTQLCGGSGTQGSAGLLRDLWAHRQAMPAALVDAAAEQHGKVSSAAGRSSHGRHLTATAGGGPQQRKLPSISHPLPAVNSNPTQFVYVNYYGPVTTTNLSSLFHVNGSTMCELSLADLPTNRGRLSCSALRASC